jgi:hypothetical protein
MEATLAVGLSYIVSSSYSFFFFIIHHYFGVVLYDWYDSKLSHPPSLYISPLFQRLEPAFCMQSNALGPSLQPND